MKIDKALLRLLCGLGLAAASFTTPTLADGNKGMNETGAATDATGTGTNMPTSPSDTADTVMDSDATVAFSELSSDEVKQIQSALNEQGSAIQVDGVIGPETRGALTDFQQRNNLATNSSEIARDTLAQLGLEDIMQAH